MLRGPTKKQAFFVRLCEEYYDKVLRYLCAALGSEQAARECTQEVFLTACAKQELLAQHPNPGGFLFQTAKNLARKTRREAFAAMARETVLDEDQPLPDGQSSAEAALDRAIDENAFIEAALSRLDREKRALYEQHYHAGMSCPALARLYGLQEPALRMRLTRLRRELRAICKEVAEENFQV